MIKFRWGLGGLFVLWVIAMALWAAVGLARSARGDVMAAKPSPVVTSPRRVLAPSSNAMHCPQTVSLAPTSASPASLRPIDVAGRRVAVERRDD